MIDKDTVRSIALAHINAPSSYGKHIDCVILDQHTLEEDFGWVFFYQSREYIETGDFLAALGGNSPLIISGLDGSVTKTGTAQPVEVYIEEYRKSLSDL